MYFWMTDFTRKDPNKDESLTKSSHLRCASTMLCYICFMEIESVEHLFAACFEGTRSMKSNYQMDIL